MAFQKIDNATLKSRGATTLPNKPTMQTEKLKQEFDAPAKEVVAPVVNQLVDDLNATYGASYLGATQISGRVSENNVQAVLQKLSDDLTVVENNTSQSTHSHLNKDVLDALSKTNDSHLAFNGNKLLYAEGDDVVIDSSYVHTDKNFSEVDKNKLDGLENYVLPKATTSKLGGVKVDGTTITANNGVISAVGGGGGGGAANAFKTVNVNSVSVTASGEDSFRLKGGDGISLSADATTKEITITNTGGGGGGTSTGDMLKAVYDTDNDGIVDSAETLNGLTATITELNYVDGVTSNIQTQLDGKMDDGDVYSNDEIDTKLNGKVSVVSGKGLSSNDYTTDDKTAVGTLKTALGQNKVLSDNNYTTTEKTKLSGIDEGANKYILPIAGDESKHDDDDPSTIQNIGGVKVDGKTIDIDSSSGQISVDSSVTGFWIAKPSASAQGTQSVSFSLPTLESGKSRVIDPYFSNSSGVAPKNWKMTESETTITISFDKLTTATLFALKYWII